MLTEKIIFRSPCHLLKAVFCSGREERKGWTLSLYNAVRGSAYTNKDDIQINTIDEILYLGMRGDISFLIAGEMDLFEQQSSFNPNIVHCKALSGLQ